MKTRPVGTALFHADG